MPFVQYCSQVMVTSAWWLECTESRELSILLINAHPGYLTNEIPPMSHGKAVVAMIINGPRFYGQSLHRFPRFFANNPLERLIRDGIAFEQMNDNIKVNMLDGFFDPEVSKVYFERAIKVKRHLEEPHHVPSLQNRSSRRVGRRIISFLSINFYVDAADYQQSDHRNTSTIYYKKDQSRLLSEYAKCTYFSIRHNFCIDTCPLHYLAGHPYQAGTHPA